MKAIGSFSALGSTTRPRKPTLAGVGRIDAGQHLDQRRLAGAVLPEQRMHLAAPDIEIDVVERQRAR